MTDSDRHQEHAADAKPAADPAKVAELKAHLALLLEESGEELTEADTIKGPGRLEGEHVSVLYFEERMMEGDGDSCGPDGNSASFELTAEEREAFGFDTDDAVYVLEITGDGFLCGSAVTRARFEDWEAQMRYEEEEAGADAADDDAPGVAGR